MPQGRATELFIKAKTAEAKPAPEPPKHVMAAEVCARFEMPQRARTLLKPEMTGKDFLDVLLKNGHTVPGIDFIAYALKPREAVWWGCLCMQHACGDRLRGAEKEAARAAVMWVMQPTEPNRAAAKVAAAGAGSTVAARLALAVSQANGPNESPGGDWATTVAGAVRLASIKFPPAKIPGTQAQFVGLGLAASRGSLG